jgi:hypothetical protein
MAINKTARANKGNGIQKLGYGLDDRAIWVSFPGGARVFSVLHCIHTISYVHPAFYTMCIVGKAAGA